MRSASGRRATLPCSGLAVLRKEEWNVLVELIQSGELSKL